MFLAIFPHEIHVDYLLYFTVSLLNSINMGFRASKVRRCDITLEHSQYFLPVLVKYILFSRRIQVCDEIMSDSVEN